MQQEPRPAICQIRLFELKVGLRLGVWFTVNRQKAHVAEMDDQSKWRAGLRWMHQMCPAAGQRTGACPSQPLKN